MKTIVRIFASLGAMLIICVAGVATAETKKGVATESNLNDLDREERELTQQLYNVTQRKLELLRQQLQEMGTQRPAAEPLPAPTPPLLAPAPIEMAAPPPMAPPPVAPTAAAPPPMTTPPGDSDADTRAQPVDLRYAPPPAVPAAPRHRPAHPVAKLPPAAPPPVAPLAPEPVAPPPTPPPTPPVAASPPAAATKSDLPAGWDEPAALPPGAVPLEKVKSPYSGYRPTAPAATLAPATPPPANPAPPETPAPSAPSEVTPPPPPPPAPAAPVIPAPPAAPQPQRWQNR